MKPVILIVDDYGELRELMRMALQDSYVVLEAPDGLEGLAQVLLGDQAVDLVVTDLRMPLLSGVDLLEALPEDIPVIVISAYLDAPDFRERLERIGPDAVFKKPFMIQDLKQTVDKLLVSRTSP